jgi:hypothetical protein
VFLKKGIDFLTPNDILSLVFYTMNPAIKNSGAYKNKYGIDGIIPLTTVYPDECLNLYVIDGDYKKFRESYEAQLNRIMIRVGLHALLKSVYQKIPVVLMTYDETDKEWSDIFFDYLRANHGFGIIDLNKLLLSSKTELEVPNYKVIEKSTKKFVKGQMLTYDSIYSQHGKEFQHNRLAYLNSMNEYQMDMKIKEMKLSLKSNAVWKDKYSILYDAFVMEL